MSYTPKLTYATVTWATTKCYDCKIEAHDMKFLQGIIVKTQRK